MESSLCRITLMTKKVSPLLARIYKKYDHHSNYSHNEKCIHMLKIAQIISIVLCGELTTTKQL